MRVAFLITKLDYSGGPKMLAWVTNQFASNGHDVHLISIYSNEISQTLHQNVHVHCLGLNQSANRLFRNTIEPFFDVKSLSKMVDSINPDLIISFLYSIDMYYMLYAKCIKHSKRKFIVSMRMDPFSEKRIADKVRHKISTLADGYVFQSEGAKSYFSDNLQKRGTVIFNPVTQKTLQHCADVECFTQRNNEIVLPARLNIPQKRQDVAIKAAKIVIRMHPEIKFTLLGNGPDQDQLQCMINNDHLESCVTIHKAVPSAEEYVKHCKIMLLTSDFEGVPNSLIEAMAIGVNVISTDCSPGGARMLIKDGINGFLVERGDSDTMAKKICSLLDSPQMADALAKEGRKICSIYSEQSIASQWIEYALRIVNN